MSSIAALRAKQAGTNLSGKVAVVVGGTNGIGEGIALRLADAKANVVIVGRNAAKGQEILAELKSRSGAPCGFITCDASLLSNVQEASKALTSMHGKIDYLVLTCGIAAISGRQETKEGLDLKLAVHYYSRMAFIQCLAPALKKSEDPRVMSVLSAGVHGPYKQYKTDPELKADYSLKNAADLAGFYNDLAADFFSEMHSPIKFVHAAPGIVSTSWGTELPWALRCMVRVLQKFAKSKSDCAEYMVSGLIGPQAQDKRFFLMAEDGSPAKQTSMHAEARDFIRAHTLEVLGRLMKQ